jgi:hypothetical protein
MSVHGPRHDDFECPLCGILQESVERWPFGLALGAAEALSPEARKERPRAPNMPTELLCNAI